MQGCGCCTTPARGLVQSVGQQQKCRGGVQRGRGRLASGCHRRREAQQARTWRAHAGRPMATYGGDCNIGCIVDARLAAKPPNLESTGDQSATRGQDVLILIGFGNCGIYQQVQQCGNSRGLAALACSWWGPLGCSLEAQHWEGISSSRKAGEHHLQILGLGAGTCWGKSKCS